MQRKNPDKMNKIIEMATKLFSERDYHDVKLDEVARLSGVGKGSIYTYFKSKDYLFFKCLSHGVDEFTSKALQTIKNESFDGAFRKLIGMFVEVLEIKGPMLASARKHGPKLKLSVEEYNEFISMTKQGIDVMTVAFKKGLDEGLLDDTFFSPRQMAIVFQGCFDISTAFIFHGERPLNEDRLYEVLMRIFKKQRLT